MTLILMTKMIILSLSCALFAQDKFHHRPSDHFSSESVMSAICKVKLLPQITNDFLQRSCHHLSVFATSTTNNHFLVG